MSNLKENLNTFKGHEGYYPLKQLQLMEIAHTYYEGNYYPLDNGYVYVKYDRNKEAGYLYQENLLFDEHLKIFKVEKSKKFELSDNIIEITKEFEVIMSELEYQKWGKYGLKYEYEIMCQKYIDVFTEKQSMDKDGWTNYVGGIYGFNQIYFFNFDEIRWDIDTNQPPLLITDWFLEKIYEKEDKRISYVSYTKGLRYD